MKLLDRYILRQFFLNFIILLVVMMTLIVLVDMLINLDEFADAGGRRAQANNGSMMIETILVMADYYGPQTCFVYIYIAGLIVSAAVGFTFTNLARGGELVTMISSGISLYRVAVPVLIAACAINGLTILDQELVVPKLIDKLTRQPNQLKVSNKRSFAVHYAPDSKGNLISAAEFDPVTHEMLSVSILERDAKGRATRRVTATQARWDEAMGGWVLIDGNAIRRGDMDTGGVSSDTQIEPAAFFSTDLAPQVLMARRAVIYPALLSMAELGRLMNNPAADSRAILRIMHSRFSLMILNVLILVLVLPLFLTREPVNPVKMAISGTVISIGSWMAGVGLLQLLSTAVNPVIAAWLPVVVFLPISAVVLQRMKT